MAQLNEDLDFEVLAVVSEIPRGKVATYGQIARLIGQPNQARLVGKILSRAEYFGDYPCHRVVNQAGRLVPGWADQAWLLQAEGIPFKKKGYVDMAAAQWED